LNENKRARYQARARIIKAMAHPTRLFLVDALSEKSQCVAELTQQVGADMSTVSKHLAVLKNVGIVEDEKKGAQIFYRLKTPCVMNFFGCVETVMKSTATQQLKLVK
jgi:DNA-binding transcriptional ArsR family regulator